MVWSTSYTPSTTSRNWTNRPSETFEEAENQASKHLAWRGRKPPNHAFDERKNSKPNVWFGEKTNQIVWFEVE